MEFSSMWEQLMVQGAMFYIAVGSVAVGTMLILVAGFAQLRNLGNRHSSKLPVAPARKAEPELINHDMVIDTYEALEILRKRETAPIRHETPDMTELAELLQRLQVVADKIEGSRRESSPLQTPTSESRLKETVPGVDYVFRAGTG